MTGLKSGSLLDRRLSGESGMAGDNFARRTVGVTRIRKLARTVRAGFASLPRRHAGAPTREPSGTKPRM
jgi:hypothetical protein